MLKRVAIALAAVAIALAVLVAGVKLETIRPNMLFPPEGVKGVDTSEYQGPIDVGALRDAGIEFIYAKATEGSSHIDSQFPASCEQARNSSVALGAYHFFSFDSAGADQAANFISSARISWDDPGIRSLRPAIDVEWYGDKQRNPPSAEDVRRELRILVDAVEAACGAKPLIYAGNDIYDRYLRGYFDDCGLWIACRKWPSWVEWPQGGWSVWQYSDVGEIAGAANDEGHVDLDVLAEGLTVEDLLIGKPAASAYLSGTSFSPETETAINDFIAAYGKDAPGYDGSAYVVSDFDNTTAIFDITYQCNAYQLQTMAFALAPDELRSAIGTYIDEAADGNALWLDDIENAYRYLWESYGPFTPEGLDEEARALIQADPQWLEFAAKMKAFYEHVEETLDDPTACAWVLNWYSGMSEDEVYELFKRSCETYRDTDTELVTWTSPESIESRLGSVSCEFPLGVSVTDDVRAMLAALSENGIDVWICSASHADGVRAAVDAYGLGDYVRGVIGMTQKAEGGVYVPTYDWETGYAWVRSGGAWEKTDRAIRALPSREGKVEAIENALVPVYGCGPLAGFMDSSGDFNFCTEFDSMRMVICYNRADRKITEGAGLVGVVAVYQRDALGYDLAAATAAGDTYYLLQGRDENGKRTLRPSDDSVKLGQTEPQLFANADNEALLAYLEEQGLSCAEAFDGFAAACAADDSENVLGVPYGYLDEYDGYHSHTGDAAPDALTAAA